MRSKRTKTDFKTSFPEEAFSAFLMILDEATNSALKQSQFLRFASLRTFSQNGQDGLVKGF
jgi:hypothetical protein